MQSYLVRKPLTDRHSAPCSSVTSSLVGLPKASAPPTRLLRLSPIENGKVVRTEKEPARRNEYWRAASLRPCHAYTPPLQATFPARRPRTLPRASASRALEGTEFQAQRVDARPCGTHSIAWCVNGRVIPTLRAPGVRRLAVPRHSRRRRRDSARRQLA